MMTLFIRRSGLLALAAVAAFAAFTPAIIRGEDKPEPKTEAAPNGAGLLRKLIDEQDAEKKKPLREGLLKLGVDGVRDAIKNLSFAEADETGKITLDIKNPDGHTRCNFLRVPGNYDAKKSYPMIVILHGGVFQAEASDAEDFLDFWATQLGEKWSNEVLLLVPAAQVGMTDPKGAWFFDTGMNNVCHVISEIKGRYNVDDDRVFLTGFSDGGAGAYCLAMNRPEPFAGYFPMCGHPMAAAQLGTHCFASNFKGQKIYAINGAKDRGIPAAETEALYKQINEDGADIKYLIDKQAGHDMSYAAIEIPRILDDMVGKWTRTRDGASVDWTCDNPQNGRRGWLSVDALADLGDANAKITPKLYYQVRLGITLPNDPSKPLDQNSPVIVDTVQKGSTADAMGIKKDDKIIKLDDTEVSGFGKLREALTKKHFGDDVTVVVKRGDEEITLKGNFALPVNPEKPTIGRVTGKFADGGASLEVYNVSKLSIWATPETAGKGEVTVTIGGKKTTVALKADAALLLSEFERTRDRKQLFTSRGEVDVCKLLGVEPGKKPTTKPKEEDF
ncbi:MAG: PDZ domain-containing protein [Planctomycetes bacterium]|nr:PDZ domain-containing protein [Planctomycetota bacterium]